MDLKARGEIGPDATICDVSGLTMVFETRPEQSKRAEQDTKNDCVQIAIQSIVGPIKDNLSGNQSDDQWRPVCQTARNKTVLKPRGSNPRCARAQMKRQPIGRRR
jgi:hypothetical protein